MAQGANQIEAQHFFVGDLRLCQTQAYEAYDFAVNSLDIAKEVARQLLPVSIYSTCYVTMNLRALMNFLSLRTDLTALWEIRQVAQAMERQFASAFPQVHRAWDANGRIAP